MTEKDDLEKLRQHTKKEKLKAWMSGDVEYYRKVTRLLETLDQYPI